MQKSAKIVYLVKKKKNKKTAHAIFYNKGVVMF